MINEVEGRKILESFRGRPKADVEAVVDILLKVSKFSMDLKESVLEMDLNPIIVQSEGNGAKVVDSRFIVCRNI
jgi:acyl-CoA synthetase (NDP forming)